MCHLSLDSCFIWAAGADSFHRTTFESCIFTHSYTSTPLWSWLSAHNIYSYPHATICSQVRLVSCSVTLVNFGFSQKSQRFISLTRGQFSETFTLGSRVWTRLGFTFLNPKCTTEGEHQTSQGLPSVVFQGVREEIHCQRVCFLRNAQVHTIDKYKAFLEYHHRKKLLSYKKYSKLLGF